MSLPFLSHVAGAWDTSITPNSLTQLPSRVLRTPCKDTEEPLPSLPIPGNGSSQGILRTSRALGM